MLFVHVRCGGIGLRNSVLLRALVARSRAFGGDGGRINRLLVHARQWCEAFFVEEPSPDQLRQQTSARCIISWHTFTETHSVQQKKVAGCTVSRFWRAKMQTSKTCWFPCIGFNNEFGGFIGSFWGGRPFPVQLPPRWVLDPKKRFVWKSCCLF